MKGSAQKFLNKAIRNNGKPRILNTDKRGTNIIRAKYLNNIIMQDHRSIKKRITISTGFKEFEAAQRTLAGIEVINMI
ncbi:DDE-type integrase/transposase/recombinase [uncultured Algibacter sp.]|uniref:DDE-type integrase/transposase/recombinase n=1 Tax=uncultured Algibacter sp. TaxID=298659 RepID=UPI0030EF9CB4|tara:strand:- start:128 stop:361 length:234 start_codon:yes stop_codon:yes gene_type:complete